MFATSERVSPCRARCSPRSVGRVTLISSPSCATVMSRWMRSESSPRGPCTRTTSGSIVTVTPVGTEMGLRPMRDMASWLPDLCHDLAADALLARLVAGHDAVGRRDDGGAHAALDLAHALGAGVAALAGTRDAAQARDGRAAVLGVLERDADDLAGVVGRGRLDLVAGDVALLGEDAGHLRLQLGRRDVHRRVRRMDAVADPREEVGDGVSH